VTFQVGDRVSVTGGIVQEVDRGRLYDPTQNFGPRPGKGVLVSFGDRTMWCPPEMVTLIERPPRKLRVGSVWERISPTIGKEYDRYVWTGLTFVSPHGDRYDRETRDFDTHPELWHEVPVEELEREAAGGS
jgi:hypothetical protein